MCLKKVPLNKAQIEICNLEECKNYNEAVNVQCISFSIGKDIPKVRVEEALNHLIKTQQALRLQIYKDTQGYYQAEKPYIIQQFDWQDYSSKTKEELSQAVKKESARSISYLDEKLYYITLYQLQDEVLAVLTGHHVLFDALSFLLFAHLTLQYCEKLIRGEALEENVYSFTESCLKEQTFLGSTAYKNDVLYYEEMYKKPPTLCKVHKDAKSKKSGEGGRIEQPLEQALAKSLVKCAKQNAISPGVVFQTAITAWLISQNPKASPVAFSQMIHGRKTIEEKSTVGNFAKELIFCVDVGANPTYKELLNKVALGEISSLRHASVLHDEVLAIAQQQSSQIKKIRDLEFGFVPIAEGLEVEWINEEYPETTVEYLVAYSKTEGFYIYFHYIKDALTKKQAKEVFDGILHCLQATVSECLKEGKG